MTQYASTEDILNAYQHLSNAELLAVRAAGRRYLDGTRFSEPLDLAHEALTLALDGRRNWPTHIDFAVFMAMTMRSVADADRKRHGTSLTSRISVEDLLEMAPDQAGSHPSVEDEILANERCAIAKMAADIARAGLAGDAEALAVLDGMSCGMAPCEIREAHGFSAKAFDAAKHRAMRKVRAAGRLQ